MCLPCQTGDLTTRLEKAGEAEQWMMLHRYWHVQEGDLEEDERRICWKQFRAVICSEEIAV